MANYKDIKYDFSGENLTALNATQLTSGTTPDARYTTLPAVSGANLTSLTATNLSSGTVPTARLGTGTASSSTILYGDNTWAAAGGGDLVLLASVTASADATVEFSGYFSSDYYNYYIYFNNVRASAAPKWLSLRLSTAAGYFTGATDYGTANYGMQVTGDGTGTAVAQGDSAYQYIALSPSSLENDSNWDCSGFIHIPLPTQSAYKVVNFQLTSGEPDDAAYITNNQGSGVLYTADDLVGVQFLFASANISTGNFRMYGLKNA